MIGQPVSEEGRLESRFTVLLVNARHLKQVPGRKSDIRDCQWIVQLLQHGLLKGSFIPPRSQRELRDLTRHRRQVIDEKVRTINRLQKVLEDANIKLASVAPDIVGSSGRAGPGKIAGQDPGAEKGTEGPRDRPSLLNVGAAVETTERSGGAYRPIGRPNQGENTPFRCAG